MYKKDEELDEELDDEEEYEDGNYKGYRVNFKNTVRSPGKNDGTWWISKRKDYGEGRLFYYVSKDYQTKDDAKDAIDNDTVEWEGINSLPKSWGFADEEGYEDD